MGRKNNQVLATGLRVRNKASRFSVGPIDMKLERIKSLATIFSAIAIPIVLTVAGYFIQRQLSSEGIRKDYVGIATAILKEKAEGQEPELRKWAVKILDENAPIPFSKKAKDSLLSGVVVAAGPAWIGPPDDCRIPPVKRTIFQQYKKLATVPNSIDTDSYMKQLVDFANSVGEQEVQVLHMSSRLKCMQEWAAITEKYDIEYRNSIGAPSSKSVLEELKRKNSTP